MSYYAFDNLRNEAKALYRRAEAACGLVIGDCVKITRKAGDHEYGWNNSWNKEMDKFIGQPGVIKNIPGDGSGIRLTIILNGNTDAASAVRFPFFVLKKIDVNNMQDFKPFEQVLVRQEDMDVWVPELYKKFAAQESYPHRTFSGGYAQCISYKGNENLTYTNLNPKE